ncbi:MAG: hypothetical protein RR490_06500 [Niameybacter sp.]
MVTMKMIRYNISESFNVVRWCLTLLAFSFVAVVSVAKYIQLSDNLLDFKRYNECGVHLLTTVSFLNVWVDV